MLWQVRLLFCRRVSMSSGSKPQETTTSSLPDGMQSQDVWLNMSAASSNVLSAPLASHTRGSGTSVLIMGGNSRCACYANNITIKQIGFSSTWCAVGAELRDLQAGREWWGCSTSRGPAPAGRLFLVTGSDPSPPPSVRLRSSKQEATQIYPHKQKHSECSSFCCSCWMCSLCWQEPQEDEDVWVSRFLICERERHTTEL